MTTDAKEVPASNARVERSLISEGQFVALAGAER